MKKRAINLILMLLLTLAMLIGVVVYTAKSFHRISASNIYEVGRDKISGVTASLENYLDTSKSVLWVTADTVDYMLQHGDSNEQILSYMMEETTTQAQRFDENYTGLYGYINGEYLDGAGWVPPEGYDPVSRDWYKAALAAQGELTIVPPYVDMQTGSVVITITKLLSDGKSSFALDVIMNHVQSVIQSIRIKNKGYAFVVDADGLVIAHQNSELVGVNFADAPDKRAFIEKLVQQERGSFEAVLDGRKYTAFSEKLLNQWYVVIAVSNQELFAGVWRQIALTAAVNLVVFLSIALFDFASYRNEMSYNRRMEEMRVNEQAKEYESKVLKLEKSAADAANKAKSDFLAEMSHEIRTPINAVLGMNEMILREAKDAEILEYAKNIQSAGRTLLTIVNGILDFSKIEDGKMEIAPVRYDVSSMIHDLINSIIERVRTKSLEFEADIDPAIPATLCGDDIRLSQIIMNLLTNAVKYTEKGTVKLVMRNDGREGDAVFLKVEVRDTGIGIRKEDMGKLFASFERLEEKRNRHIEGTGLGISIVTRLLEMMDSKLEVESIYGLGSVFSFRVKQRALSEEPLGDYSERLERSACSTESGSVPYAPETAALVVDDKEMNLKVVKNLMKLYGITPDLALSGEEAIERAREKRYDIIFLDHMMPKMDGIETLALLKKQSLLPEGTTVIALTANAIVGAKETYLAAGFDDYLSKPIEIDKLEDRLIRYLPPEKVSFRTKAGTVSAPKTMEEPEPLEFAPQQAEPEPLEFAPQRAEPEPLEFAPQQAEPEPLEFLPGSADRPVRKASEDRYAPLRRAGVSVEEGMRYNAGMEDFYLETLTDYLKDYSDTARQLDDFRSLASLKDYRICVHALKSASKTIGASELAAQAKNLEDAAAREDKDYLSRYHAALMEAYYRVIAAVAQTLRHEIPEEVK